MVLLPGNPAISGTCGPYFPETFRSPTLRHVLFYHRLYGRFELREFTLSIPFLLQYAPHVHRRLQPGPLLDSPPFSGIRGVLSITRNFRTDNRELTSIIRTDNQGH